MPKLSSRLGQIHTHVKRFVDERVSLAGVRGASAAAVDLIFPPHGFDRPEDGAVSDALMQAGMTADAWSRIRFLDGEGCDMCARPFDGGLHFGAGALCSACVDKPFPFARTRAACLYGDASREMILAFKHGDRLDLAPMLARWLQRAGADVLEPCDVIVPVPLHPWRLLGRRYNQAAELARPLARWGGRTYLADGLQRTRMTKQQGHSPEARWDNVRGAFAVTASGTRRIADKSVVLIDDVFTTGATLRACTDTLLKAGAKRVDTLVLARAVAA